MGDIYALNLRRARQLVGQTLHGKWHLDDLLGVGGMAAVFAATHRNGSRAAVKMLHKGAENDPNTRRRFQREGYVANKVGHHGVPRVLDDDVTDDGRTYLVMELLEGESIEDRTSRKKQLPQDEVMHIAHQALDVLAAAHEKGIVHRDIKPDNLFLTKDGEVKVLDFGIAGLHEAAAKGTAATQIGDLMGTLEFMSPEQSRGQWDEVDARSDLWSLGATLYTMLTGRAVHVADTVPRMLAVASSEEAKPLANVLPDAHPTTCQAIDGALRFKREDRFQSAREMQVVVEQAFQAVCGRSIDDPLALSIGEDDAETVTKLMAIDVVSSPASVDEMTEVTVPRGRVRDEASPADEGATVPFRPGDSGRPPMASLPPITPPIASVPPAASGVGGGQTWIKQALAEPGHAKGAMWLVRLGFAAVVLMMVGAVIWILTMPKDETPDARAQPLEDAAVGGAVASAEPEASTPGSGEEIDDEADESSPEPTATATSTVVVATSAAPTLAAPTGPWPTVSVDPAWPPKSAATASSEPPSQFLKPGPLGPEMDP